MFAVIYYFFLALSGRSIHVQNTTVIGNKGYDSSTFVEANKGCEVVIPPKSNRKVQREYDRHIYKERYLN
ncbi:hypothetical protein [Candidatus Tisiphia endosymbiont of Xenochironomus xenolabis]|uniref:hypothetical protein n=1 Tax=Candidatus Tisiphia endosymbiont of Xenochironomus xenolabis TaxID=3139334 RepID=UPI0035C923C8